MALKAILFDWDGTLYNLVDMMMATYIEVFERVGLAPWSEEDFRQRFTGRWEDHLPEMGLEPHKDLLLKLWDENMVLWKDRLDLYPHARSTLKILHRKHKLAVVSSAPKEKLVEESRRLKVDSLFDVMEAQTGPGYELKPSPKPLLRACEHLGVYPAECVYVGDMVSDVRAAKAAAIRSIAVCWGLQSKDRLKHEDPDAIVDSFSGLLATINGW